MSSPIYYQKIYLKMCYQFQLIFSLVKVSGNTRAFPGCFKQWNKFCRTSIDICEVAFNCNYLELLIKNVKSSKHYYCL